MTDKAKQLITDFKNSGWQTPNLYERLFELTSNSNAILYFATEYLKSIEKNSTIFNDSLSYIEESQFPDIVNLALYVLKTQKNENAENVIEYTSLQFPDLLHNDLEFIFENIQNYHNFYAFYPWRKLAKEKIQFFENKLTDIKASINEKRKLFECLLQTRDIETVIFAYNFAIDNNLFATNNLQDVLLSYLELVGFTIRNGTIENYCLNKIRHFSFQRNYFSKGRPIHINKEQHPTWNLNADKKKYKFGGILQDDNKNPFVHLITFDEIPDGLNITQLTSLTLGIHIRELNECGAVFYKHDNFGKPTKIGEPKEIEIFSDLPIKETEVSFAETPNRWAFQSWGTSNSRENLFRLGGEPTWIQNAEVLVCPISNEKMDFLMQLDTDLPDIENGEVYFGSGGICYAFWCDKTKVSGYVIQCT
mgnify:CR=1 FL=1